MQVRYPWHGSKEPVEQRRRATAPPADRQQRRALIVSTGRDRGALAAAPSLRQAGWFVGSGTPDGGGMLGSSRAFSVLHVVPRPRFAGNDFVAGVRRAVADGSYDVVLGGGDDRMAALSAYREDIPSRVAHPESAVVEAALDRVTLTLRARPPALAMQGYGKNRPRVLQQRRIGK